jgi:hypothetical protein
VSFGVPAVFAVLVACGGGAASTTDATSAALSATSSAGDTTTLTNFLTTDAQCDRAATDDRTCDDACAKGTDHPIDACVATAVACLEAAAPPAK